MIFFFSVFKWCTHETLLNFNIRDYSLNALCDDEFNFSKTGNR